MTTHSETRIAELEKENAKRKVYISMYTDEYPEDDGGRQLSVKRWEGEVDKSMTPKEIFEFAEEDGDWAVEYGAGGAIQNEKIHDDAHVRALCGSYCINEDYPDGTEKVYTLETQVGWMFPWEKPKPHVHCSVLSMTNKDIIKEFNHPDFFELIPICFEGFDFDGWRQYMFERGNVEAQEAIEVSYENHAKSDDDVCVIRINWEGERDGGIAWNWDSSCDEDSDEEDDEDSDDEEEVLEDLTCAQLKTRLRAINKPVGGRKADLIQRIREHERLTAALFEED